MQKYLNKHIENMQQICKNMHKRQKKMQKNIFTKIKKCNIWKVAKLYNIQKYEKI